jgi:hypothetical protein
VVARRSGMSVVYYVPTDTDDLLIATMADRAKAHAADRDCKVGLCVPGERWPFAFLQVYADAEIERERDLVVDVMMAVAERMWGQRPGDEARPFVEAMAEREDRVVVRCRPMRHSPRRHSTWTVATKHSRSPIGCPPRSHGRARSGVSSPGR